MSKEMREQINKVMNWEQFLNENRKRTDEYSGSIEYKNQIINYEVEYNWGDEDLFGFRDNWYFKNINIDGNDIDECGFDEVDEDITKKLIIKDIKLNYPDMM